MPASHRDVLTNQNASRCIFSPMKFSQNINKRMNCI